MPTSFGIEIFANWNTLVLAVGIFVVTYVLRLITQTIWQTWRENRIYNELVLHLLPLTVALAVALFAKKFPWPNAALVESASARVFYATFVGMACGLLYGRVRAAMGTAGVKLPSAASVIPDMPKEDDIVTPAPEAAPDSDSLKTPTLKKNEP